MKRTIAVVALVLAICLAMVGVVLSIPKSSEVAQVTGYYYYEPVGVVLSKEKEGNLFILEKPILVEAGGTSLDLTSAYYNGEELRLDAKITTNNLSLFNKNRQIDDAETYISLANVSSERKSYGYYNEEKIDDKNSSLNLAVVFAVTLPETKSVTATFMGKEFDVQLTQVKTLPTYDSLGFSKTENGVKVLVIPFERENRLAFHFAFDDESENALTDVTSPSSEKLLEMVTLKNAVGEKKLTGVDKAGAGTVYLTDIPFERSVDYTLSMDGAFDFEIRYKSSIIMKELSIPKNGSEEVREAFNIDSKFTLETKEMTGFTDGNGNTFATLTYLLYAPKNVVIQVTPLLIDSDSTLVSNVKNDDGSYSIQYQTASDHAKYEIRKVTGTVQMAVHIPLNNATRSDDDTRNSSENNNA